MVQLEFFGSLDGCKIKRVQLDVFRSLKGGPIEIVWSFKGCCWKSRGGLGGFIGASGGDVSGGCSSRFWKNVRSPNQTRYGQDSMCVL